MHHQQAPTTNCWVCNVHYNLNIFFSPCIKLKWSKILGRQEVGFRNAAKVLRSIKMSTHPPLSMKAKNSYNSAIYYRNPDIPGSISSQLLSKSLIADTPKSPDSIKYLQMLAGHTCGCWLSAVGAGVPYNRAKKQKKMPLKKQVSSFHYF